MPTINQERERLGLPRFDIPEADMPMDLVPRKPSVASLVHRNGNAGCEAAIVTYVWPDGTANLVSFSMYGESRPHLHLPQGTESGAWHWPSAVCVP